MIVRCKYNMPNNTLLSTKDNVSCCSWMEGKEVDANAIWFTSVY